MSGIAGCRALEMADGWQGAVYGVFRSGAVVSLGAGRRGSGSGMSFNREGVSMKKIKFGRMATAVLVMVLGSFSAVLAASQYHLLKKHNFGPAEGSTREYFDYIMVD